MKPPPILWGLFISLWFGFAKAATCAGYPKENIVFGKSTQFEERDLLAKYINHFTNTQEMYTLSCYILYSEPHAVLRTASEEQVVTLRNVNCRSRQQLTENTIMYTKRESASLHLYLGLNVPVGNSNVWCGFDINLTKKTVKNVNDLTPQTETLWNWSEPGSQVSALPMKGYHLDRKNILADYVNNGNLKFVLHCFKNKNAIMRTPKGQRISTILNFDCANENLFIQTFFIHTITTRNNNIEKPHLYRMNDPLANAAELPWYNGVTVNGNEKHVIWFYPFFAEGKENNCYWNKINIDVPDSCPSLPYSSIIDNKHKSKEETEHLSLVARYSNLENPKLQLTCFKSELDNRKRHLSVISYSTSDNHIATLTNIDCSSIDNLNKKLFIQFTNGDPDLSYITIGKRDSTTESWCSYSLHRRSQNSGYFRFVYYTLQPVESVASWKENPQDCSMFEGKITAGNYASVNYENSPSKRYIWLSKDVSNIIILICYKYKDSQSNDEKTIALFKNMNNEVLASVVDLDCLNLDQKYYTAVRIIDNKKILSVGVRNKPEDEWCMYNVCVDCTDKTVKLNPNNVITEEPKWSEPGVQWKQGLKEDYKYNDLPILNTYISQGKTKFVLVCTHNEPYKHILKSTSGVYVAKLNFSFDCKTASQLYVNMLFITENNQGKLDLHTVSNCKEGCDVEVGSNVKESWIYSFEKLTLADSSQWYFRFYTWKDGDPKVAGHCSKLSRSDFLFGTPAQNIDGKVIVKYRTGKDLKINVICYMQDGKTRADFRFMDTYMFTLNPFACEIPLDATSLFIAKTTTESAGDDSQLVVGVREPRGMKHFCYYNIIKIPNENERQIELYYDYSGPNYEWYKDSQEECPMLKKHNIIVGKEKPKNLGREMESFVGKHIAKGQYIMLRCYESSGEYTAVITSLNEWFDWIVAIKGLGDCNDKKYLKRFYINYWTVEDKPVMTLGSVTSDKVDDVNYSYRLEDWCRYDIYLNHEPPEINVNTYSSPSTLFFEWSEVGTQLESRPMYQKTYHPSDNQGNVLSEIEVKYIQYSQIFSVIFVQTCYKGYSKDEYIMKITSTRGFHLGTIRGYNCEYNFYDLHLHIERGGKEIYSGGMFLGEEKKPRKEDLCWYYGCLTPADPQETVKIYYLYRRYVRFEVCPKWTSELFQVKNAKLDWCYEKFLIPNLLDRPRSTQVQGVSSTSDLGSDCLNMPSWKDIQNKDIAQQINGLHMIVKYVRKKSPKLELHCYIKEQNQSYRFYFVIAGTDGKPIFMITGQDCSPVNGMPRSAIFVDLENEELNEDRNVIFVGKTGCWYKIIYGNSIGFEVGMIHPNHKPKEGCEWQQVPTQECPGFNPEYIYKEENQTPLREDKIIARYMNKYTKGLKLYNLYCYQVGEQNYVSAIKSVDRVHAVFVKGLLCSSKATLQRSSYIRIRQEERKLALVIGTRLVAQESTGPWCLFEACLTCDTLQTTATVTTEEPFEWSENGMKINECPSLNPEKLMDNFKQSTIVAEYEDDFAQDCRKVGGNKWFLQLKTRKGMYIQTIPVSDTCADESELRLVRRFQVHVGSRKKVFKSSLIAALDDAAHSCWDTNGQIKESDVWLYYFHRKPDSKRHMKIESKTENCPYIMQDTITTDPFVEDKSSYTEIRNYYNGGDSGVTITIYEKLNKDPTKNKSFVVLIRNSVNSVEFQIKDLDLLKNFIDKLDLALYIEYEKNFLIVGSRSGLFQHFCWYIVYHTDTTIDKILITKHYELKHGASQWYNVEDAKWIKRSQIVTEEIKDLNQKDPFFVKFGTVKTAPGLDVTAERFYSTFYITKDAEGNLDKRCSVVIRSEDGRHLATVQECKCHHQLTEYMFRYSANPNYLIVGITDVEDMFKVVSEIQFDICLNCKENAARLNTHNPTKDEYAATVWNDMIHKIEKEPSFKNQGVTEDNASIKTIKINEKMPLFVVECHSIISNKGVRAYEYEAVLRTYTGLILGTIKKAECDERYLDFVLQYMVEMKNDGTFILHDLGITEPPAKGEESCWFYGCKASTRTEIREKRVDYKNVQGKNKKWKTVSPPNNLCPKDSLETILKKLNDEYYMMAEYTNSMNFKFKCYMKILITDVDYITVVWDPKETYVTYIQDVNCVSEENVRKSIEVLKIDGGNEVHLFSIRIKPKKPCTYCSYTICTNCEREKCWPVYRNELVQIESDWKQSVPKECYNLPRKNIIVKEGEIKLNGYTVKDIFINEDENEENMFIVTCYQQSDKDTDSYAHIKLLNGQLVAYIKGVRCMSKKKWSLNSYMSLMKFGENKYFTLVTRLEELGIFLSWCRYDICLDCANGDDKVRLNLENDPDKMPKVNLSTDWLKGSIDTASTSNSGTLLKELLGSEYPEYNVDCYNGSGGCKDSVIKKGETPLIKVSSSECISEIDNVRTFYIYTLYQDSKYSLIRYGPVKPEESTDNAKVTEKVLFTFNHTTNIPGDTIWKQKLNPVVDVKDTIDKDENICIPKAKSLDVMKCKNDLLAAFTSTNSAAGTRSTSKNRWPR